MQNAKAMGIENFFVMLKMKPVKKRYLLMAAFMIRP
jgi:hypothetical protein